MKTESHTLITPSHSIWQWWRFCCRCVGCCLVSQPEGSSCSSWCAYGRGFNSPLHTSTFFLLLHLSLSFSCCGVLSCVRQQCFDCGGGGFPQSYCRFFHSIDCQIKLLITQELFGYTKGHVCPAQKCASHILDCNQELTAKDSFLVSKHLLRLEIYCGRAWREAVELVLKVIPFLLFLICLLC